MIFIAFFLALASGFENIKLFPTAQEKASNARKRLQGSFDFNKLSNNLNDVFAVAQSGTAMDLAREITDMATPRSATRGDNILNAVDRGLKGDIEELTREITDLASGGNRELTDNIADLVQAGLDGDINQLTREITELTGGDEREAEEIIHIIESQPSQDIAKVAEEIARLAIDGNQPVENVLNAVMEEEPVFEAAMARHHTTTHHSGRHGHTTTTHHSSKRHGHGHSSSHGHGHGHGSHHSSRHHRAPTHYSHARHGGHGAGLVSKHLHIASGVADLVNGGYPSHVGSALHLASDIVNLHDGHGSYGHGGHSYARQAPSLEIDEDDYYYSDSYDSDSDDSYYSDDDDSYYSESEESSDRLADLLEKVPTLTEQLKELNLANRLTKLLGGN